MSERYSLPPIEGDKSDDSDSKDKKKSERYVNVARGFMGQPSERLSAGPPKAEATVNRLPPLEFFLKKEEDDDDDDETALAKAKAKLAAADVKDEKTAIPPVAEAGTVNDQLSTAETADEAATAAAEVALDNGNNEVFELPEIQAEGYGSVAYEDLDMRHATQEDIATTDRRPADSAIPSQRTSNTEQASEVQEDIGATLLATEVAATDSQMPIDTATSSSDAVAEVFDSGVNAAPAAPDASPGSGDGGNAGGNYLAPDSFNGDNNQPDGPLAAANLAPMASAFAPEFGASVPKPSVEISPRADFISPNLVAAGLVVEHFAGARADKQITTEMRGRMETFNKIIDQAKQGATEMMGRQTNLEAVQAAADRLAESQGRSLDELKQSLNTAPVSVPEVAPATPASVEAPESARQNRVIPPVAPPLFPPIFNERQAAPLGGNEMPMPFVNAFESSQAQNGRRGEVTSPRMAELLESRQNGGIEGAVPNTDLYAEANVRPSVMMEQVAQAAENDVPVEIAYERRHEVRDDPGGAGQSGGGGAASVGSILTDHYQPPEASARQLAETQAYLSMNKQQGSHSNVSYGGAMKGGFAVGMAVAIIGALAYVVFG